MDSTQADLLAAEDEVRQHATKLRARAHRLRRRGFIAFGDELEAHAIGLDETAAALARERDDLPPSGA